jgi:hypothetical protein
MLQGQETARARPGDRAQSPDVAHHEVVVEVRARGDSEPVCGEQPKLSRVFHSCEQGPNDCAGGSGPVGGGASAGMRLCSAAG